MAHALSRRRVVSPYRRVFSFLKKAYRSGPRHRRSHQYQRLRRISMPTFASSALESLA
jgi:hypothetical protein